MGFKYLFGSQLLIKKMYVMFGRPSSTSFSKDSWQGLEMLGSIKIIFKPSSFLAGRVKKSLKVSGKEEGVIV